MPTRRELLQMTSAAAAAAAAGGSSCIGWTREESVEVDSWRKSVCRFCGSGCETEVGLHEGRVATVRGLQAGWNRGRLCIKGILNRDILYVSDRALHPMVRRDGRLQRATWDEALDAAAAGLRRAIESKGPDAVGFYGSGQLYTQESYAANKLFKAGIRTNNVDGNPRLCMASPAAAYKSVFGADEPSGCYEDFDHATLFFVIGANPAECHPVIWERILDRRRAAPETRIIVVDPRRTPTTRNADMHLQHRPGTDVALLNAMCHEIIHAGLVDRPFVEEFVSFQGAEGVPLDFDGFVRFLDDYAPEKVAQLCALSTAEIREAARWFATEQAVTSLVGARVQAGSGLFAQAGGGHVSLVLLAQTTPEPIHGASIGGTLGTLAAVAIVVGVAGLILVEFGFRRSLHRAAPGAGRSSPFCWCCPPSPWSARPACSRR